MTVDIVGFVENTKPYDVRIVVEGEKENLDRFIEQIKIEEDPILVDEVDVTFEEPTGEFEYFEVRRGDMTEELGERLDLARGEMKKLHQAQKEMIEKQDQTIETLKSMKEDTSAMLEKQDMMLEKQDGTIGAIKEVSEKIDSSKEGIVNEIRSLREDLKSYMEERFVRIEREIEVIKAKIGLS